MFGISSWFLHWSCYLLGDKILSLNIMESCYHWNQIPSTLKLQKPVSSSHSHVTSFTSSLSALILDESSRDNSLLLDKLKQYLLVQMRESLLKNRKIFIIFAISCWKRKYSCWQKIYIHHWMQGKLSKWQHMVQLLMEIASTWQHSTFSVIEYDWCQMDIQIFCLSVILIQSMTHVYNQWDILYF